MIDKQWEYSYKIGVTGVPTYILDKSYYNYAVGSASTYNAYNVYPLPEFNVLFKLSRTF